MAFYRIDPLRDPRWPDFLQRHRQASVFHTQGWLEALRRTYGYQPVAWTTSGPKEELKNGLLFCDVKSWVTGRRMVSLPFSDHCQPLVDDSETLQYLLFSLHRHLQGENVRYIEVRSLVPAESGGPIETGFAEAESFYLHKVDLQPDLDELLRSFHMSCVQRRIRRAERAALSYEEGPSKSLLEKFYHLFLLTRQRHHLPPPPLAWFHNLTSCIGRHLKIRVVSKEDQPVAGILTLSFKNSVVYKYGCSDPRFNSLGGTVFLLWKAIQDAKASGASELDLGRSSCENSGLITFKDHWNATRSRLIYYRNPPVLPEGLGDGWKMQLAKRVMPHLPDRLLTLTGSLMYKHCG